MQVEVTKTPNEMVAERRLKSCRAAGRVARISIPFVYRTLWSVSKPIML
jgi:hypothetical protein